MIEDGENIERNSSEEIESQGMYIYIYIEHMHVLLKLYIYLFIYSICKLIMYYLFEYVQMKSVSMMRC